MRKGLPRLQPIALHPMALRQVLLALLLAAGCGSLCQPTQACDKHLSGHSDTGNSAAAWR